MTYECGDQFPFPSCVEQAKRDILVQGDVRRQIARISFEIFEALDAFDSESRERVIEELIDVQWATQTALEMYGVDWSEYFEAYQKAIEKNRVRGYCR